MTAVPFTVLVITFEVLMDAPTDISTLLRELDVGNDKAVAELVVLLYSELHRLASRYLQRERSDHTLQTTALVHEAYLRLADQRKVRWKNEGTVHGRRCTIDAPYSG